LKADDMATRAHRARNSHELRSMTAMMVGVSSGRAKAKAKAKAKRAAAVGRRRAKGRWCLPGFTKRVLGEFAILLKGASARWAGSWSNEGVELERKGDGTKGKTRQTVDGE
jgi:hypothetical protein